MEVDPSPGKHILTIIDENGESVSRDFEIMEKEK
jgi:penicillin-binding protein 1C